MGDKNNTLANQNPNKTNRTTQQSTGLNDNKGNIKKI